MEIQEFNKECDEFTKSFNYSLHNSSSSATYMSRTYTSRDIELDMPSMTFEYDSGNKTQSFYNVVPGSTVQMTSNNMMFKHPRTEEFLEEFRVNWNAMNNRRLMDERTRPGRLNPFYRKIYEAIAHGDQEHKDWLKNKLIEFQER